MLTKADEGGRGGKPKADHCWRGGEGGWAKCWPLLTRGGGGVTQMLTIADGGGRGGPRTPDFGWRNMWTAPTQCPPSMSTWHFFVHTSAKSHLRQSFMRSISIPQGWIYNYTSTGARWWSPSTFSLPVTFTFAHAFKIAEDSLTRRLSIAISRRLRLCCVFLAFVSGHFHFSVYMFENVTFFVYSVYLDCDDIQDIGQIPRLIWDEQGQSTGFDCL